MNDGNANLRAKAIATFSSKGNRAVQEDAFLVDREKGIFIVADGFGGAGPGAEAAKVSCESVRNFLFKEAGDLDATLPFVLRRYFSLAGNVLFNSLIHANRQVMKLNKNKNVHEKGGASVIASFVDGDLLAVANVGVCEGWLLRGGQAAQLVMPRSFGKLVDPFANEVSEELKAPLIAIGMSDDLEPEIFEYRLRPGDWLFLHTDGVPSAVRDRLLTIKQNEFNNGLQENSEQAQKLMDSVTNTLNEYRFEDNAAISLVIF